MKCPVCKTEISDHSTTCPICEFNNVQKTFVNLDDAQNWEKNELLPFRAQWEKQNSIDSTLLRVKERIETLVDEFPNDILEILIKSTGTMILNMAKMIIGTVSNELNVPLDDSTEYYDKALSYSYVALLHRLQNAVRHPENLKDSMLNLLDTKFWYFDFKFLYIDCPPAQLMWGNYDSGIVVFAYIDYSAGITFDVLADAHISGDNTITISRRDKTTAKKIRFESFNNIGNARVIDLCQTNFDISIFADAVANHDIYYKDLHPDIATLRMNRDLDSSRYPANPDDIQVWFIYGGKIEENPWVRYSHTDKNNGFIYGTLLNEPRMNYGVHQGDIIPFRTLEIENGRVVCVFTTDYFN